MKFYNIMTAQGFSGGFFSFFMAWIGLAILIIIGMFAKKWLGEEEIVGFPYNWIGSLIGPFVYIITVSFTGSSKLSLVLGLIGLLAGGFGLGATIGGTE